MLRILVLEDETYSREALRKILQEISQEITVYAAADLVSARLLLDTVSFDLFLLDVNLNPENSTDCSGIEFAKEIRSMRKYEFTPLVMVTSVAGMEMEAYRKLHCYQYIVKPYIRREIEDLVQKLLFHQQTEEHPSIVVKKDGINYKIGCDDILCCKAVHRGVCLFLKGEQMIIPYVTIRQLKEKLPKKQFFQCHRMFVVNRDAVKYYDFVNQILQVEGCPEQIDIGVTFKADVKRRMNE